MRDLLEGAEGRIGVGFGRDRCQEKYKGFWGFLDWLGCYLRECPSLGFGIWAGITLFWAVAPVRGLAWVNGGWFGVVFGHEGRRGEDWGFLENLFWVGLLD